MQNLNKALWLFRKLLQWVLLILGSIRSLDIVKQNQSKLPFVIFLEITIVDNYGHSIVLELFIFNRNLYLLSVF